LEGGRPERHQGLFRISFPVKESLEESLAGGVHKAQGTYPALTASSAEAKVTLFCS